MTASKHTLEPPKICDKCAQEIARYIFKQLAQSFDEIVAKGASDE